MNDGRNITKKWILIYSLRIRSLSYKYSNPYEGCGDASECIELNEKKRNFQERKEGKLKLKKKIKIK